MNHPRYSLDTESALHLKTQLSHEISRQIHNVPSKDRFIDETKKKHGRWSMESRKIISNYNQPVSHESLQRLWSKIPNGLEPLTWIKSLNLRQQDDNIDLAEQSLEDIETLDVSRNNTFDITDDHGNLVYQVKEKLEETKGRGPGRRYVMGLYNLQGQEVLTFRRHVSCCKDGTEVMYNDGSSLGRVIGISNCYICALCSTNTKVMDLNGNAILFIEDHGCCSSDFTVVKAYNTSKVVAYISKRYEAGFGENNAGNSFILEFRGDRETSPVIKAVLITAVFYFDVKYFEATRARITRKTRMQYKKMLRKSRKNKNKNKLKNETEGVENLDSLKLTSSSTESQSHEPPRV